MQLMKQMMHQKRLHSIRSAAWRPRKKPIDPSRIGKHACERDVERVAEAGGATRRYIAIRPCWIDRDTNGLRLSYVRDVEPVSKAEGDSPRAEQSRVAPLDDCYPGRRNR
jgi:hypothetical protein